MKRTWNTTGTCIVEIARDACPFDWLEPLLVGETEELVITFRAKGYHTPASMYGGPDHLGWPEEGDEERTLVGVTLCQDDAVDIAVIGDLARDVFERFEDEVMKADLPEGDDEC